MDKKDEYEDYNPNFYCFITEELMVDPVIDPEGNSYERTAIEKWLRQNATSPITRNPLQISDLRPNRALRSAIEAEIAAGKKHRRSIRMDAEKKTYIFDSKQFTPTVQQPVDDDIIVKVTPGGVSANGTGEVYFLTSAYPPDRTVRVPADICCVVDVSGSMDSDAGNLCTESGGLTILDIVKHAMTTIINTLDADDRLALVAYSSIATVVFGLLPMNEFGKTRALELVNTLRADGMTNLWDGLEKGLNVLKAGSENRGNKGNSSIMLLTDGVPNVEPPRGYVPMLQRYREKAGGKLPGTITTFGFGYQLNSALLKEIAVVGGSHYGFIPDSGMVGTAFVNALANILSTSVKDAVLRLETMNGARFSGKPLGSLPCKQTAGSLVMDLGDLQIGQSRDVVVKVVVPSTDKLSLRAEGKDKEVDSQHDSQPYLRATITYRHAGSSRVVTEVREGTLLNESLFGRGIDMRRLRAGQLAELASQIFRLRTVEVLESANQMADINRRNDLAGARKVIADHTETIQDWLEGEGARLGQGRLLGATAAIQVADPWTRIESLLQDLEGQGVEAFCRSDWYERWGVHYIPSLARAHQLQQCTNFKDPGLQHYGGEMFRVVRDHADEVFCSLPPVVHYDMPESSSSSTPVGPAPIDMRRFNNPNNPCFHGDCMVLMADGSSKRVRDVRKGDRVAGTADGAASVVQCVVVTEVEGSCTELVELADSKGNSLLVTAWHPLIIEGSWQFPVDVSPNTLEARECDALFSFLLCETSTGQYGKIRGVRGTMIIGGYEVATLGMGIQNDPVVSHAFFGTEAVVEELSSCLGWQKGMIRLRSGAMRRVKEEGCEEDFGLVCGIRKDYVLHDLCST